MLRARLLLALALTCFALPAAAQLNENQANAERMDRLERDLMLLQRQIARGDARPLPVGGAGDDIAALPPGSGAGIEVRLTQIEEELRALRGKVEESDFKTSQLSDRLDKMQKDVDFRFNELSNSPAGAAAPKPLPSSTSMEGEPTPLTPPQESSGIDKSDIDKLTQIAEGKEHVEGTSEVQSVPADGNTSAGDGVLKTPDQAQPGPREKYNTAFKLLNQTKYDEASQEFREFISKYPKDPLIGNAYYWLGETHYINRDYVKAADTFRQGFEALPNGPKAADNLLKLSMSLSAMKKEKEACIVLDQILVKFSKTSATITQKAEAERTRLGCK